MENDPDIVAMVAASAALTISGVPFMGPIGAARVGYRRRRIRAQPDARRDARDRQLDLVVAGTADAVMMVESEAKELTEDVMLGAVMFGHRHFQPVIDAIIELAEQAAKEPCDFKAVDDSALEQGNARPGRQELRAAYAIPASRSATTRSTAAKAKAMAHFPGRADGQDDKLRIAGVFKELEAKIVRRNILDDRQAHRRPRRQDRSARSSPKSASCRAPTARRCSPAARRRRWS